MVKKIHERPKIIAEAKQINSGPSINMKVSANEVHEDIAKSMMLSFVNKNRRSPNTWRDRLSLVDEVEVACTALDIGDPIKVIEC